MTRTYNNNGNVSVIVVILISVMAAGLIVAAWYYEANKEETSSNANTKVVNTNSVANVNSNLNVNSVVNINSDIATADWQTYTNDEWRISFNYPEDWQVVDLPDPKVGIALASTNYQPITSGAVTYSGEFYVSSISNPNNLSVEQLFDTFSDGSRFWFEKFPHEEIDIGSSKAVRFPSFQDGTEHKRISTYITGEKQVISLSYLYGGSPEFENIFNQILSTFQFIDKVTNASCDTDDWSIFTNERYGYNVMHPSDATIELFDHTFSLSTEEYEAGMTFEEKRDLYGSEICVFITVEDTGYVNIAAAANQEAGQICGRTGVGVVLESFERSDNLIISSTSYTGTGHIFIAEDPATGKAGTTLNYKNETNRVTLSDGMRIEYSSIPNESIAYTDYETLRDTLICIIESIQFIE